MGQPSCRTSGNISASALIFSGRTRLVSLHCANAHASNASTITLYDNTAGSGTIVATMVVPAADCREFDMHGVICSTGLYATISGGTASVTVEFA